MEKIFFVKNGELNLVNNELSKGGRVKQICPVAEPVSSSSGGDSCVDNQMRGTICAYIVIEK